MKRFFPIHLSRVRSSAPFRLQSYSADLRSNHGIGRVSCARILLLICFTAIAVWGDPIWIEPSGPTADFLRPLSLRSIAYGNGQFVATGVAGTFVTSTDGTNWSQQSFGTTNHLAVTYANGLFVTAGGGGTIITSADGSNWAYQLSGTTNALGPILYANGKFLTLAVNPDNTLELFSSPDATNWASVRIDKPVRFDYDFRLAAGNGIYVLLMYGRQLFTSTDLVTWIDRSPPGAPGPIGWLNAVSFVNNRFVALGYVDINFGSASIVTSEDGVTWTAQAAVSGMLNSITYGNGTYVAVGATDHGYVGTIASSQNTTNWVTSGGGTQPLQGVAYGDGLFVAYSASWANTLAPRQPIITSPDGYSWTPSAVPASYFITGVTYGNGRFVAIARNESGPNRGQVILVAEWPLRPEQTPAGEKPVITRQPASQPARIDGSFVVLSVVATGSPPLNYQWFRNGTPSPNETNSSRSLSGSARAQVADYFVVVSNAFGSVTSAVATVSLRADISGEWLRQTGGNSIAIDPSGIYVTGRGPDGSGAATLIKYDSEGNLLWAQGSAEGSTILQDSQGNILVAGPLDSPLTFGGIVLNPVAAQNSFLVKYDPLGNLLWAKQVPGVRVLKMATAGADFVLTGWLSGNASFGDVTLASRGQRDIFLAKYDNTGSLLWARQAGGAGDEYGNAIATSEFIYVTGPLGQEALFEATTVTNSGIFLAAYDSGGNLQWVKQPNIGFPTGIVAATDIYIAGHTGPAGQRDIFFARLTGGGTLQWMESAGGPNDDYAIDLREARGRFYLTGAIQGEARFGNSRATENRSDYEVFVAKYDFFGELEWVQSGGGPNNNLGTGVGIDASGNIYLIGDFTETVTFPPHSLSATGQSSFLLKIPFLPVFRVQPQSQVITPGTDLKLEVGVGGSGPFYYEWFFNGSPVAGALNNTLVIANFQPGNAGNYHVVVHNPDGSATSQIATLRVSPSPGPLRFESPALTANGFTLSLSGQPGLQYRIDYSNDLVNWSPLSSGTNLNGSVTFLDSAANNFPHRFYRAVSP